jgi:hypothetical protein
LFWQHASERSELFTIIGIAALFLVFPSATVANENPGNYSSPLRQIHRWVTFRSLFLEIEEKYEWPLISSAIGINTKIVFTFYV